MQRAEVETTYVKMGEHTIHVPLHASTPRPTFDRTLSQDRSTVGLTVRNATGLPLEADPVGIITDGKLPASELAGKIS
jgi:hypothetical protein